MKSLSTSPRIIWVSIHVNRQPTPLILDICFRQIDVWFSWTTSSLFINYIVDHYSLTIASLFTKSTSAGQLVTYRLFRAATQTMMLKLFLSRHVLQNLMMWFMERLYLNKRPITWSCFISFILAWTSCWTTSPVVSDIKHFDAHVIMIVTMPDWRREFNT